MDMPSSITVLQLCENMMRDEMRRFIDHEVDMTTFAKPAFFSGHLNLCKTAMHRIASDMDLRMEAHRLASDLGTLITRRLEMQQQLAGGHEESTQSSTYREMAEIDELTSTMSPLVSASEEIQHVPIHSDQIQELSNRSLSISTTEKGECSSSNSNAQCETLDQNSATFTFVFLANQMNTALHSRLIEETKHLFAIQNRILLETNRRDSWMRQNYYSQEIDWTRAENWKAEHACLRDRFFTRAELQPPPLLRVIDIEATCRQGERVVLIDWADADVQRMGYTAITHTYGMDVYEVFNCRCTSECSANVRQRCSDEPCTHDQNQADASSVARAAAEKHKRVVNDILRMCDILRKAGVNYAWHDGVCIAQHDEQEVKETIQHMGWVYGNARDTVVFLHYVGDPMAPIRNSNAIDELGCRWHTRVWTLQEGALSKCRRYCVRVGTSPLGDCQSLEELEEKIALWYEEDSRAIEIIEEERFFEFVKELHSMLCFLFLETEKRVLSMSDDADDDAIAESMWKRTKVLKWLHCTRGLLHTLFWTCFQFPSIERALLECGADRKSKHIGDYMNSILALAGVKDFVAPKDEDVEASTIKFFKKQGQKGLALALFSINFRLDRIECQHTWPPVFGSKFVIYDGDYLSCMGLEVLQDGKMELRTEELLCVKVRFTAKLHENRQVDSYTAGMYVVSQLDDFAYLDMDLTVFDQLAVFKAKVSETSSAWLKLKPGGASSISDMSMGTVHISAIETRSSDGCTSTAEQIEDGDSMEAHLAIPMLMEGPGILIVQGSLESHVSKSSVISSRLPSQLSRSLLLSKYFQSS